MNSIHGHDVYFSRRTSYSEPKRRTPNLPPVVHFRPHRISFALEALWYKFFSGGEFDIVHAGEYSYTHAGNWAARNGAKRIITVHDLIHEKFGAPGSLYSHPARTAFYQSADGLLFISENTRKDFFDHYDSFDEETPHSVVYHGVTFPASPTTSPTELSSDHFLFVGSREGYKNFFTALEAFRLFLSSEPSSKLIIAGSPPSDDEKQRVEPIRNQVRWLASPNDETLREAYRKSVGLLYVSEYEGFGLPLLEAMSQGCVPLAGNHSSVPEVLGKAGILINDVTSPQEIAAGMKALLADSDFRCNRVSAGLKQASRFSWSKAAQETHALYRKAMAKRGQPS